MSSEENKRDPELPGDVGPEEDEVAEAEGSPVDPASLEHTTDDPDATGDTEEEPATATDEESGLEEDELAVLSDGLKPGETVVTDGQFRLSPGARVLVRGPAGGTQRTSPSSSSAGR